MANLEDMALLGAIGALENAEIDGNNRRIVFQHRDAFQELSDSQFIKIYRLSKPLATELFGLLEPFMIHPTRLSALNIERKVISFSSLSYFFGH